MNNDHNTTTKHFKDKTLRPEDLFMPSVVEIVRHMARIAAEQDYKHFLATGEIPYCEPNPEEVGDD